MSENTLEKLTSLELLILILSFQEMYLSHLIVFLSPLFSSPLSFPRSLTPSIITQSLSPLFSFFLYPFLFFSLPRLSPLSSPLFLLICIYPSFFFPFLLIYIIFLPSPFLLLLSSLYFFNSLSRLPCISPYSIFLLVR